MADHHSISSSATGVPPPERQLHEKNDSFLIDELPLDDPSNPKGWSNARKWYITMTAGLLVLNATFASSAPGGIAQALLREFKISREVEILTISLFVAGYCVGPLLWGPLSEEFGRRPIFIVGFFVYMLFQIGAALAQNVATILVVRFLGGVFAACPLANSGAVISDIWDAKTRGRALAVFTVAPFAGPSLGPTVAGFIYVSGTSWRWLFWVLAIFAGVCWLLIVFTLPETYTPILLVQRAKKLRKETGDDRYHAPMEVTKKTIRQRTEYILLRPFKMLFLEPMLLAMTAYMSFVYGCLYLLFAAYPIVFTQGHHLNAGISGLMFIPILVGGVIAVTIYTFTFGPRYEREVDRCAPNPVVPEFRLEMTLIAAPVYAISFFWFGWTSYPSISLWAPMMSGVLNGFGVSWVFLGLFNYLIDTYLMAAASALAINTVVRSIFGAVFPLFATQMYEALGNQWASTLLGFVALAMTPIPFVFMKYGAKLRARSRYSPYTGDEGGDSREGGEGEPVSIFENSSSSSLAPPPPSGAQEKKQGEKEVREEVEVREVEVEVDEGRLRESERSVA
ncbi:MFS general substrate transporter [Marasmius fiardii PR-910]|nr:MFS general substrate transporter [Marasmius fiardii PR-910]